MSRFQCNLALALVTSSPFVLATALTRARNLSLTRYVEVATLQRDDLFDVLASFPMSLKVVQQAAIKIAMQRAVIVVFEYIKMARLVREGRLSSTGESSVQPLLAVVSARVREQGADERVNGAEAVSYTHLTLPTICSV